MAKAPSNFGNWYFHHTKCISGCRWCYWNGGVLVYLATSKDLCHQSPSHVLSSVSLFGLFTKLTKLETITASMTFYILMFRPFIFSVLQWSWRHPTNLLPQIVFVYPLFSSVSDSVHFLKVFWVKGELYSLEILRLLGRVMKTWRFIYPYLVLWSCH